MMGSVVLADGYDRLEPFDDRVPGLAAAAENVIVRGEAAVGVLFVGMARQTSSS